MPIAATILLDILIIFAMAKLAGELFERVRQPAVLGEILAGVLIGPYALALIGQPGDGLIAAFHSEEAAREALRIVYDVFAEVGIIVLLFFVGLETRIEDLLSVGRRAAVVAVLGIVLPFVFGYLLTASIGYSGLSAVFVGTALVATSVGITARVLSDLGVLQRPEARIILGAAVVDDILAMILLAIVTGIGGGEVSWGQISLVIVEAIAFTAFVALVGARVIRRYDAHLDALHLQNGPFVVAMVVCLGLSALAGYVGLAAIIGAFLAGMVFSEARQRDSLIAQTRAVAELLVPFFFVVTGAQVDPRLFLDWRIVGLALAVTVLAIAGKLIGCSIGAWGLGKRSVAVVGVGMVPRGEVGVIVATLGLTLGALSRELFSVVIMMSVLTTLIVPPVLHWIYRGTARSTSTTPQSPHL
ncbi:MAG: cation:proton antiporter [Chloroflexi bacterium]|nr:cation:proton antiporter [Chloroflexota bacterium]